MILFKACPRCLGDVDITYSDDPYCVQCAHRPTVVYPGPRIVQRESSGMLGASVPDETQPVGDPGNSNAASYSTARVICPKCGSELATQLDKLRPEDHTCFRCRRCGHVFSPGEMALYG